MSACQEEHMRQLADDPQNTVYKTEYEHHEAWSVARLRPLLERLAARVSAFPEEACDFTVRKTCLDDPEVLAFQRVHPQLYWQITDRARVRDKRFKESLGAMLIILEKRERGDVAPEQADAMATQAVMAAVQQCQSAP